MPLGLSLLLASASLQGGAKVESLLPFGPYEAPAAEPERALGYAIGSRITTYRDQERALDAAARAFPRRVRRIDYGVSVEGRPLRVYVVGSEANLARWDETLRANEAVATKGAPVPKDLPAVVWINETIHGNEPASFESAMSLVYNLAASRNAAVTGALKEALVVVNPCYNPDGHERFAVWYDSLARGDDEAGSFESGEPSAIHGRLNHYRFDMNRDRIAMSQDETRAEVALFRKVRPQVYVDQHGQVENYFFPPNPMAVIAGADRGRIERWTDLFGRGNAAAFDKEGWSYFVRREFDLFYPGYLDSFTSLSGAIGMTYETDGGKTLSKLRSDGSEVTLREGVAKHLVSALATIRTAAAHRADLLASWAGFKRDALSGKSAGAFRRVLMTGDVRELRRLAAQLESMGIRSGYLRKGTYTAEATDYWTGVKERHEFSPGFIPNDQILVVDMAQENGALARAMLEPQSDFEAKFTEEQTAKKGAAPEGEEYPGPEGDEFYDLTGWALPYTHGLRAWWTSDPEGPETYAEGSIYIGNVPEPQPGEVVGPVVAYARRYRDRDDILAAAAARRAGARVAVITKPTNVGGVWYERGDFFAFVNRNEGKDLAKVLGPEWRAVRTSYPDAGTRDGLGSESVAAMAEPKIGIAFGDGANLNSVGASWWLFDRQYRFPFVALRNSALGTKATRDFSAIVLPAGAGASAGRLKEWVRQGGVLVILGDASVVGESGLVPLKKKTEETRSLPGSLFRATVDPRPLLTASYGTREAPAEIAVPLDGKTFYAPKKEGGTFVRVALSGKDKPPALLHGWSWGKETDEAVSGAAFVHDEPLGDGHVVWFASDPTERALYPGLERLMLNALFLLPGN